MVKSLKIGPMVVEAVTAAFRSNLPLMLVGRTGIGKSEVLVQAAESLKIPCIVRDLSLLEATDLLGMPAIQNERTIYYPPTWLPHDGSGLLFFDELNRARRDVLAPCYQLLTSRRLNDYRLPEGWLPVAAINPPDDGYDVEELDHAMLARFMRLPVEPDVEHWSRWATQAGVHASVIRFVRQTPGIFKAQRSDPRGWTKVGQLLQANPDLKAGGLLACVAGLVHEDLARAFLRTLGSNTPSVPDSDDLAHRYLKQFRRVLIAWKDAGNTDLLKATQHQALLFLQRQKGRTAARTIESVFKNLRGLADDLPPDLGAPLRQKLDTILRRKSA